MAQFKKIPTRDEQIAFMEDAAARMSAHMDRWITKPEVKQGLHRYDQERADDVPRRAHG